MNLDHYQIIVKDAAPLYDFLTKLPGLQVTLLADGYFEVHGEKGAFSVYESAGLYRAVGVEVTPNHGGTIVQIGVDDVSAYVAPLKGLGIETLDQSIATPWGTQSLYFVGPSGIRFEIYSWN